MKNKPLAGLSMDLDNQWSYMKTHGDPGWEFYPSYFDVVIPRTLDLLEELGLSITFFLIGKDVRIKSNHNSVRMIIERGHEPGNHSLTHEPWLHLMTSKRIEKEIQATHNAISEVCGCEPTGFRGPGFSWSRSLLEVLYEYGYKYDASSLPTYIGPLARVYYFWNSTFSGEDRKDRAKLFGSVSDGFRPVKPYYWKLGCDKKILEIPVTTIPVLRLPFHLSYLIYLSRYSVLLMEKYLKTAILFCRLTNTYPSFLLHPLDLLGSDDVSTLAFFPGMDMDGKTKRGVFMRVVKILARHFTLVNMREFSRAITGAGNNVKSISLKG